jgi:hypothetical protein
MMIRMAGCMTKHQRAVTQRDRVAIGCLVYSLRSHWHYLPVQLVEPRLAIHRPRSGNQFTRVDQVTGTPRMHQAASFGETLHHQAGSAGVVKVHVCRNHIANLLWRDVPSRQALLQDGYAVNGSCFYHGTFIPFL